MEEVTVPRDDTESAEVDLCPRCGGVFLDFFDGEPGDLARGVITCYPPSEDAVEISGELTCPDCQAAMTPHQYLDRGPGIGRCDACLAAFATPAQLQRLADMVFAEEPDGPPSLMQRLRELLFPSS